MVLTSTVKWTIIISIGILLKVIAYFIYRWRLRKAKTKIQEANRIADLQAQAFLNQMKPHFIFNAINPLQSYILKDKKEEALEYLSKLVNFLRELLRQTNTPYMSISQKIIFLDTYIQIQQERFGFTYKIDVDSTVDRTLKLPVFILQPLVENAIEHGIANILHNGWVCITISQDNAKKAIVAIIENNGSSLPDNDFFKEDHALSIISQKLSVLKQEYGTGSLYFQKNEARQSISVTIELPIIH